MRRSETGHSGDDQPEAQAVLIAGVGILHASDLSFGRILLETLTSQPWPKSVVLEDMSYCPLMVYQWLEEAPEKYLRGVFLGAEARGRRPGTLELRRWRWPQPSDEELQGRIADAYMGIVSLENLLIICSYFGSLPDDTLVLEIEPASDAPGTTLSPICDARMEEAIDLVRQAVDEARP